MLFQAAILFIQDILLFLMSVIQLQIMLPIFGQNNVFFYIADSNSLQLLALPRVTYHSAQ
jgi:hypothetical protein